MFYIIVNLCIENHDYVVFSPVLLLLPVIISFHFPVALSISGPILLIVVGRKRSSSQSSPLPVFYRILKLLSFRTHLDIIPWSCFALCGCFVSTSIRIWMTFPIRALENICASRGTTSLLASSVSQRVDGSFVFWSISASVLEINTLDSFLMRSLFSNYCSVILSSSSQFSLSFPFSQHKEKEKTTSSPQFLPPPPPALWKNLWKVCFKREGPARRFSCAWYESTKEMHQRGWIAAWGWGRGCLLSLTLL